MHVCNLVIRRRKSPCACRPIGVSGSVSGSGLLLAVMENGGTLVSLCRVSALPVTAALFSTYPSEILRVNDCLKSAVSGPLMR